MKKVTIGLSALNEPGEDHSRLVRDVFQKGFSSQKEEIRNLALDSLKFLARDYSWVGVNSNSNSNYYEFLLKLSGDFYDYYSVDKVSNKKILRAVWVNDPYILNDDKLKEKNS